LILDDPKVDSILGSVPFSEAWFFDSENKRWSSIVRSKPYVQGTSVIGHTRGFWLNVTEDSNLTVAGLVPSAPNIFLTAGWNLIGFPSFNQNITVGDLKSMWTARLVEGFDPLTSPYNLRKLQDSEIVLVGYGYWVWVESSGAFQLG
jgi:hypothetical protein